MITNKKGTNDLDEMDFLTTVNEHFDIYATYGKLLHEVGVDFNAFTPCKVLTHELRASNREHIEVFEYQAYGFYRDEAILLQMYAKIETCEGKKVIQSLSPMASMATDPDNFIKLPDEIVNRFLISIIHNYTS